MKIVQGPFADVPAVQPGWATIATGNKGVFVLGDDKRLTFFEKKFGNYKYMQVFAGPHSLSWTMKLASDQATYKFDVSISARVQLADTRKLDPIEAGITNSRDYLEDPVKRILQKAVGSAKIDKSAEAAAKADDALALANRNGEFSPFVLSNVTVKVDPDPAAMEHIRKIDAAALVKEGKKVISEQKDIDVKDIAQRAKTIEELIAARAAATTPEEREAYDMLIKVRLSQDAQRVNLPLQMLEQLLQHNMLEEHQMPEIMKNYLALLKGATDPSPLTDLLSGNSDEAAPDKITSDPGSATGEDDPKPSDS